MAIPAPRHQPLEQPLRARQRAAPRSRRRVSLAEPIPFHRPAIGEREIEAAIEVLRSGWLTTGPKALAFEHAFAERIGVRHALAVSSATAALHLALDAFGVRPTPHVEEYWEVTLPTYTFTACAAVVEHLGARPDLADVGEDGLLGPEQLKSHILPGSQAPRVVMPVHFAGQASDVEGMRRVAPHARFLEDAAHSTPSKLQGDAAAYSFYATKPLTTGGEGGMLVTDNDELYQRAKLMRLHGIGGDVFNRYARGGSWAYVVEAAGFKYNLSDLQAAIGLVQLERVDETTAARARIAARYDAGLVGTVQLPPRNNQSWHLYVIRVDPDRRDQVIQKLAEQGIGASVHFIPLHLQTYYQRRYGYWPGQFPIAERLYRESISLPIWPDMTDDQVDRVIEAVTEAV